MQSNNKNWGIITFIVWSIIAIVININILYPERIAETFFPNNKLTDTQSKSNYNYYPPDEDFSDYAQLEELRKPHFCEYNAFNCNDFSSQREAQHVFELCGGIGNDVHWLDSDKDGIACESLPF